MTPHAHLPERIDAVVRGARVLSMDDGVGELPAGDVRFRDGEIVAVGERLDAPGAVEIDGHGAVLMPGFVDTHWHVWGSLLRGAVGESRADDWFARKGDLGPHFLPGDTAAGARLGLVEGLGAGITTVHDWAHNVLSLEDAEANVAADLGLGLRVHFSWGAPSTTPGLTLEEMRARLGSAALGVDEALDMAAIAAFRDAALGRGDARLTVGVNLRGPARSSIEVVRQEFAAARSHGLPIAMHCAGTAAEVALVRQVRVLEDEGLLGSDILLAHGNHLPPDDVATVAAHGIPISISPLAELRLAMGFPQVGAFLAAGITVSFSHDATAIAGGADPFAAMRLASGIEAVLAGRQGAVPARVALRMATIDGARSLGLGDVTGSIVPGKRADLVLVRLDAPNVAPAADPAVALVHSASPANVDLVVVDGRVLKRSGRLVAVDPMAVAEEAGRSLGALRARAGSEVAGVAAPAGREGGR